MVVSLNQTKGGGKEGGDSAVHRGAVEIRLHGNGRGMHCGCLGSFSRRKAGGYTLLFLSSVRVL